MKKICWCLCLLSLLAVCSVAVAEDAPYDDAAGVAAPAAEPAGDQPAAPTADQPPPDSATGSEQPPPGEVPPAVEQAPAETSATPEAPPLDQSAPESAPPVAGGKTPPVEPMPADPGSVPADAQQ